MEEKVIIKGEFNRKRILKKLLIGAAAIFALTLFKGICDYLKMAQITNTQPPLLAHMTVYSIRGGNMFGLGYFIAAAVLLAAIFIWYRLGQNELTVSDKRIWGKIGLGKKMDVPLNHISSFSYGSFGSMNFNTDEGKFKIWHLGNRGMVFTAVTVLKKEMNKRQTA